uniref:Methionine synthase reductase n=1 Tax=Anopheles christyi TaxID=43041 RepID=A0A182K7F5_9DIPT
MNVLEQFKATPLTLSKLPASFIETNPSESGQVPSDHLQSTTRQPFGSSNVYKTSILHYRVLAEGEDIKTVYEAAIKLPPNMEEEYFPGDAIGLLTYNLASEVDYVLDRLHLLESADQTYEVKLAKPVKKKNPELPHYVPKYVTPRRLLSECLDIRITPRKGLLLAMASYTADECEKRLLEILASKEGSNLYNELILKNEMNFLHVLKYVATCRPPLAMLIEHLPRLQARPYTIASYGRENHIRIAFAMLNDGQVGITTHMLESKLLHPGKWDKYLYMYLRQLKPVFNYREEDLERNIIMIGPGTGVTPYIGFLEYRKQAKSSNRKTKMGSAWLLTSCRYQDRNYLYENELKGFMQAGVLDRLHVASSRDEDSQYKYVQDIIEDRKEELVQLLLDDATKLYLCGEGRTMLPRIQDTIVTCMSKRLLKECLDLHAVPKKLLIRSLISFTTEDKDRRFLEILCSKEGNAAYERTVQKGKGIISLLRLVPSCRPSAALLIEHLPRLMPRPYSIANAYREEAGPAIRFLFSHSAENPGITTSYLRGLEKGATVYFYFRQSSTFVYTESDLKRNIIMVGTGTGISPYLSFLQLRSDAQAKGKPLGRAELIVGFRYQDRGYLCRDEIDEHLKSGVLDACYEAFSRDPDARHKYVQSQLKEHGGNVIDNIHNPHASFYVCGDSKVLLPQIMETVVDILAEAPEAQDRDTIKAFISGLKKDGKYREDVWM